MEPTGCLFVRYCYNNTLMDYFVGFTRFLGIFTAVVLLGVGADVSYYHNKAGDYIIAGAFLVFFFETFWVIVVFMRVCSPDTFTTWWIYFTSFWIWPKAVIYTIGGCLLIFNPQRLWLSMVGGGMLILLTLGHVTLGVVDCCARKGQADRSAEDYVRCAEHFEDIKVVSSSEGEEM